MHLCKCNVVIDQKTRPSPHVLPCQIWSFWVKGCRHKYRKPPKLWTPRTILSWDGRRGWSQDTFSSHTCYVIFGSSAIKGVHRNRKEPQQLCSAGTLPPLGGGRWPSKASPLHMLTCQLWSAAHGVCINRNEPPKLGNVGTMPSWGGAWLTP